MIQRLLVLACLAPFAFPTISLADEESHGAFQWSSGAAIGTDYVWRGQSLTDGKPYILGEIKLSHESGVYAGIWASNAELAPHAGTNAEIDYFFGWAKPVGPLNVNIGYLYRQRPSDTQSLDWPARIAN